MDALNSDYDIREIISSKVWELLNSGSDDAEELQQALWREGLERSIEECNQLIAHAQNGKL